MKLYEIVCFNNAVVHEMAENRIHYLPLELKVVLSKR